MAFLDPSAVRQFVEQLEAGGLTFAPDGQAVDLAVVDQFHGFTVPCPWLHLDVMTAPDGTTIRHAQLVPPPGAEPLSVESLGEVAVFEGWSPACTRELFLPMAPTPGNPEGVQIASQKGALARRGFAGRNSQRDIDPMQGAILALRRILSPEERPAPETVPSE